MDNCWSAESKLLSLDEMYEMEQLFLLDGVEWLCCAVVCIISEDGDWTPKSLIDESLDRGPFLLRLLFQLIFFFVLIVLHDIHKVKSGCIEPLPNRLTLPLVIVCSYRPRHFRCTRS